jgi:hypothetical protein
MSTLTPEELEKRKRTNKKILRYLGIPVLILAMFAIFTPKDKTAAAEDKSDSGSSASTVGVGTPLQTTYFQVTVNKAYLADRINTGNEFTNLKKQSGTQYLVIDVTFKNTDTESRTITDGEVKINYNGKDYTFDKSETILSEGWGLLLDEINPLTSKRTKLVYKIPSEISGVAYYHPGRSDDDSMIGLGKL